MSHTGVQGDCMIAVWLCVYMYMHWKVLLLDRIIWWFQDESRRANQRDLRIIWWSRVNQLERLSGWPKKTEEETGEKDGGSEVPPSRENDCNSDGEVRCFCNRQREAGEMVQCKVCAGWFHLECLRMPLEQVQLRAFWSYFGVPRSHPTTSLLAEMEVLSVGWEARMRCIGFWHRILTDQPYH